jgi:hypothetical protein
MASIESVTLEVADPTVADRFDAAVFDLGAVPSPRTPACLRTAPDRTGS